MEPTQLNNLLVQQAISLFDLLPCRTIELQIAGDWLEDYGLHSFMADVVRQGKWGSLRGIVSEMDGCGVINFYGYGNGDGTGTGRRIGYGDGHGTGYGTGHGTGYGDGSGSGYGAGTGTGYGDGSG